MAKFSTNEKLNRSLDRAQARREAVNCFINEKIADLEREYIEKFGDSSGKYAYMTGFLQSVLGSVAQAESIAEMRRVLRYTGIKV